MSGRAAVMLLSTVAWACAPLAYFRAPGILGRRGRDFEVGAGVVELGRRPYVIERRRVVGQAWTSYSLSPGLDASVLAFFDDQALAGGASLRYLPLHRPPFVIGGEIELGYAWAAFDLPMAFRLHRRVWIYSAPRIGNLGVHLTPGIPLGVSVELIDGFAVIGEAQVSWEQFDPYQRRLHLGSALAYRW